MKFLQQKTREGIILHRQEDFSKMARSGQVAAQILDDICDQVYPGKRTIEIDEFIETKIKEYGVQSATIGYRGYKHASCISVNHVVCHGIPSDKRLAKGDILNIDVTVIVDGWHGDSSRMYVAGKPKASALNLIKVTYDALMLGLEQIRPGNTFGDLGSAIQKYAQKHKMSIVRDFCGHGIGRVFHQEPNVLHFGVPRTGAVFQEGMFFTVEPMINLGKPNTRLLADGWTAVTQDRSLSAQFEHAVGVTSDGIEIFTESPAGKYFPTNFILE
ncbi:MAG: type I methionyl aminopeptidase [Rhodobacteraceae bacterium]|nr:type I methionyl aminopeptidase [Paracoccaceae bacterium]